MLQQVGKVACDVSLMGTDSNGEDVFLTSKTFYVAVMESQGFNAGDDYEDEETLTFLEQLIKDVENLQTNVEQTNETLKAQFQQLEEQSKQNYMVI